MKKRNLLYLLLVFVGLTAVVSCSDETDDPAQTEKTQKTEKLTLETYKISMKNGEAGEVNVLTKATKTSKILATSSDEKVVKIKVEERTRKEKGKDVKFDVLILEAFKDGKADVTVKDGVNTTKLEVTVEQSEMQLIAKLNDKKDAYVATVGKGVTTKVFVKVFNGADDKLMAVSADETIAKAKIGEKATYENPKNFADKKELSVVEITGVGVGNTVVTVTDERGQSKKIEVEVNKSLKLEGVGGETLNISSCGDYTITVLGGSGEFKFYDKNKIVTYKRVEGTKNKFNVIPLKVGETKIKFTDYADNSTFIELPVVATAKLTEDTNFIVTCNKELTLKEGVKLSGDVVVNDKAEVVSTGVFNTKLGGWPPKYEGSVNVTSIDFANVTEIKDKSLAGCTGVTKLIFRNLKKIGEPFYKDTNLALKEIYCHMDTPPTGRTGFIFYSTDLSNVTLYVPANKLEDYKNSDFVKQCKAKGLKDENIKAIQ